MHFKKIVAAVFLVFAFTAFSFAQSDGWYYGKPIQYISFKGLSAVSINDVVPYTDPFLDREFDDEVYLDILNTVYSLEYFEDITAEVKPADADGKSLNLEFTVVEYPEITEVSFKGNLKVRNSELKEAISIEKGQVFIERKISVNERKIRDVYLEKGYTEVRVTSTVEENEKGISIVFEISEGSSSVVSLIQFEGNVIFAQKTLKKQCSLKEASLFQKGAFKESLLEADRQNILLYYHNRGYFDADISEIRRDATFNAEKDQNELVITFVIEEGDQYHYEGITIEGNEVFETEKLISLISLEPGDVFNETKFEESLEAIFNVYLENGYISNGFDYQMIQDKDNDTISCIMTIIERDRGHIENITLKGNTKTKSSVIMRELGMETGDIYSKADIQAGLRNLYNTQYFSAIEPDFVQGSEMNLIDMTLNVEEAQTTSVEFGVTFTGISNVRDLPVSAFINLSDTNFKGLGKTVSTKLTASSSEQSLSLRYDDSWFMDKPVTISLSVYASRATKNCLQYMYLLSGTDSSNYYMDYKEITLGASAALGKRWTPRFATITLTGGLSTDFIRNSYDSSLFTPVDEAISDNLDSWGVRNSLWTSVSFDNRDIYYDPAKGWFFSEKITLFGIIPEIETEYYIQSDTKAEIYKTLINKQVTEAFNLKLVFAGYTGLSFLQELKPDSLSTQNLLYIDGMFNGRGWGTLFGTRGKAMWSSYAELRLPLVENIFSIDFFFDAVEIKDSLKDVMTNTNLNDFYFSYGPGMRFTIPQFPIRLLLANTFQIKNGKAEYTNKWAFTLSFNLPNR